MTERDVVSGRTYRPSTIHDRGETIWSDTALLAAYADPTDGAPNVDHVRSFVVAEAQLPRGDRSLRDLLDQIDRYLKAISNNPPAVVETVGRLNGGDPHARLVKLDSTLRAIREIITEYRAKKLIERPIDSAKLEERRIAVESALLNVEQARFFASADIVRISNPDAGQLCTYNWACPKSRLTDPPMDAEISNEVETIAARISHWAQERAVGVLLDQEAEHLDIAVQPLDPDFWREVAAVAGHVGPDPKILIPIDFRAGLLEVVFNPKTSPLAAFALETKQPRARDYICTIEGVDVFSGSTDSKTAWLFSSERLAQIRYSEFPGHTITEVTWQPEGADAEATEGQLSFKFRQSFEWRDLPLVRISSTKGLRRA